MQIFAETDRLILREILPSDDQGMFELDSDKDVHIYLGNNPITDIEQARKNINLVRKQYIELGIGRWAMIEKNTGAFMGWTGLKLMKEARNGHNNYYDIGYRLIKKYWGKGFATESAKASLHYGFDTMKLDTIYGTAHINNTASRNVLEKIGLKYVESFDQNGMRLDWLRIGRKEWEGKRE